ncbi:MAG: bifunctional transaldolase/phosoglucose isomerase [Elusimicrobia bacterium]|nr:bifunctional transaldolase/phosoglucose isomerase [Elusimicrobiota bacterium]
MNILTELLQINQSLWLDDINREWLSGNEVSSMIKDLGIKGMTSNPSIFEKAITGTGIYDKAIEESWAAGLKPEEIYGKLMIEDIRAAADAFMEIYKASSGFDGYVSIEVSPRLARDWEKTVSEAERIFAEISRPNVMIKVPATKEGVKAANILLKKGINVNATLIFSPDRYEETARAYLDALMYRDSKGLPLDLIASVASFFVSRIDTEIDRQIDEGHPDIRELKGKTAIANSITAYDIYRSIFSSKEFLDMRKKGAKKQRILWASTSAKNPAYKETLYVDELALPDSVDTAPRATIEAFLKSGSVNKCNMEIRIAEAKALLRKIGEAGIDFEGALVGLERDGVKKFIDAHESIIKHLESKINGLMPRNSCAARLAEINFADRLRKKDVSLWKDEAEHAKIISNSLGWLEVPFRMKDSIGEIENFVSGILKEKFTDAVLLGMGGSSLAPEVIRTLFQKDKYPKLRALDTTDPAWILKTAGSINVKKTLFIFSSKSGSTIEPNSQFKYFRRLLEKAGIKNPGRHFIAITDKGTGLEKLAAELKFRKTFVNPSDIGGRFSALSYFGMVPAALCGADVRILIDRGIRMAKENSGLQLGAFMADAYFKGKDKLTLVMPEKMEVFGLWIEQLVAESTGKEGKGIVPVCMEELSDPAGYQDDRAFVWLRLAGINDKKTESRISALKNAGHPAHEIRLNDIYDIGAEFFRWETATAAAGALMRINPFDQPDVNQAKALALKVLEKTLDKSTAAKPDFSSDRISIYLSQRLKKDVNPPEKEGSAPCGVDSILNVFFSSLNRREYMGILAYLPYETAIDKALSRLRKTVGLKTHSTVIAAYGPRYLHSSGQLHKGGPDNGLFLILTNRPKKDIIIPGEKYTFGELESSQALGDFAALEAKNRRVILAELKQPLMKSLDYLIKKISDSASKSSSINPPASRRSSGRTGMEENKMQKLATKTSAAKTPKNRLTDTDDWCAIDYPANLETITSRYYGIRIGASECCGMEVSIDDRPWQSCRHASGYWWYDWHNITPGMHQIVARMRKQNGEYVISKRRRCKVS